MRTVVVVVLIGLGAAAGVAQSSPRPSTARGEWPTYAGDLASSRYSPLDQITRENFSTLQIAWRATTPDARLSVTLPGGAEWTADARLVFEELNRLDPNRWRDGQAPFVNNFKATPLMIGGTLYLNTPLSIGAAIDARTGADAMGVQPEELRSGHDDHEPALESAWRGVLDRRKGRARLLGHRRRLPALRRREDRPPGDGLRRQRARRSDGRLAACEARRARLSQRADLLGAVAAARGRRHA